MRSALQIGWAAALFATVLTGGAAAQSDPMWAPAGADIIGAINQHFLNENGSLFGHSAVEVNPQSFTGPGTFYPAGPVPERAYKWSATWLMRVNVYVFRTPAEALRCLDIAYANDKPTYDAFPSDRPWPNFKTYISHSFKMASFHDHACYRGEHTRKWLERTQMGMTRVVHPSTLSRTERDEVLRWTEARFAANGFKVLKGTHHQIAWVRGRTFIEYPNMTGTAASIEQLHKVMHALTPAPTPVLPPPPPLPQAQRLRVFIDGQLMRTQAPPTEINGRVLVGLADIFRELGAGVVWDGAQKKITATRGSRVVELWIGRKAALIDASAVKLDVPPMILAGGKTYVPVRFVSQALGAGVAYDAPNRAVMITTASMPGIGGSPTTPPYIPPAPPQGTLQISACRQTGLKATGLCPNTVTRAFAPGSVPGPCTTHAQGPKLIVTSPPDGATVPERFTLRGTSVPGRTMLVTVIAEATLKATGQNATSPLLQDAHAKVANDGKWSIEVNARAVSRDQRVDLKRMKITVQMRANRKTVEQVDLVVQGGGATMAGNRPPTAPRVTITPPNPTQSNSLHCRAEGSVDPDGDAVTYRYQWYRNGKLMADRTYAGLAVTWTKAGHSWRCVVTPTDGTVDGPSAEATVTIAR